MEKFTQYAPTEIIFGKETELRTGEFVKKWNGSRVLLVYGSGSVVRSGLLDKVKSSLETENIYFEELGGVQPNPRLNLALQGIEQAVNMKADLIVAIGGGSAIDTAKAIAMGACNTELDFWSELWLAKVPVYKALPVGVVLTISAAGSETSDSAVLTNEELGIKKGINTPLNRPKFAIMNPELTYTLPKRQLTCGIVDIMMHTLDRYFNLVQGNELTDQIAESVLRVTIESGKVAFNDQTDYHAMSEIMWAGSLSHNGLTGLGGVKEFVTHGLGSPISAKFDTYHGESLSALWASLNRVVVKNDVERYVRYAKNVWGIEKETPMETALAGIDATEAYFKSIDMPISFGELECGVRSDSELRELASAATQKGKVTLGNLLKVDEEIAYQVYLAANH